MAAAQLTLSSSAARFHAKPSPTCETTPRTTQKMRHQTNTDEDRPLTRMVPPASAAVARVRRFKTTRLSASTFHLLGLLALAWFCGTAAAATLETSGIYPMTAQSTVVSVGLLRQASAAYAVANNNFNLSVTQSASSSLVINTFLQGSTDFMVTTTPLSPVQRATYSQYKEFPIMASAVVPIYNLPSSVGTTQLVMPIQVICDIERGAVTYWNDTRLQAANPTLALPSLGITVYHLSIASSTNDVIVSMCRKSVVHSSKPLKAMHSRILVLCDASR